MFDGTTVIAVLRNGKLALAADGQVTAGHVVIKATAKKLRKLYNGKVLAGFAGATADAFTLFEHFEEHIKKHKGNLRRAAVDMTRQWRSDRVLRRLEAMIVAGDNEHLLLLSGTGDVLEPDEGVLAIGSGGNYALAAARAMLKHTKLSSAEIATQALHIAADICIYTNSNITLEEL